jgi:type I restriction enzyme S subunit
MLRRSQGEKMMKDGWEIRKIGEVCKTGAGGTPLKIHKDYYDGGNIPWLLSGEVNQMDILASKNFITKKGLDNSSAKLFPRNTVLVAMYGANAGHVGILRFEAATNQAVCGILPNENINTEFLYYCLLSKQEDLAAQAVGGAQPNISQIKVKNTVIPVPPLSEQRRIVAILDEAFAGIAAAKEKAEQNLKNAKEVFESYLESIFADAWITNKLVKLIDLATDITDGDHMPPPKSEHGIPFITIKNIAKDTRTIDFNETFMVSNEYFNNLKPNRKPVSGDVLYTVTGSFGIPVLIRENRNFCFQRHIGLIRPKEKVYSEWLYYLLMSPQIVKQAHDGATGTAQKTVSLKVLRNYQVPNVSFKKQMEIAKQLSEISIETSQLESSYQQKLADLEELKKSVLQQAFSGAL